MASTKDFEEVAKTTPRHYRMNLIEGKIEIMPVHHNIGTLFFDFLMYHELKVLNCNKNTIRPKRS